jgi:hypothetical protein
VEVSPSIAPPDPSYANAIVRDALHKAVMDFEETLQRSHSKKVTYTTLQTDGTGQPTAVEMTDTGEFPLMSLIEIFSSSICILLRVLLNECEKVWAIICVVQLKTNSRKNNLARLLGCNETYMYLFTMYALF